MSPDFAGLALRQYEVPSIQDCYPSIRPEKQGCATGYCLKSNMIEFSIENRKALNARQKRLDKSREKNPTFKGNKVSRIF